MSSQDTAPQDLAFNTDGTKMFVVGSSGDAVNEYTLSTGFDVSTATFVHSFSVSSLDTAPQGLAFNTDGTKMFVLGNSGIDVNEYTLSTGFDVSTASFVDSFSVSSQETNPLGLAFNTDGTKMFVSGTSGADVNEYTLSTGFDVSTATFVDSFSVSSQDIAPYGLAFNTDGTKMFVVGTIGDDVNEYTLSTGFDVSTASFVDSFSVSSQEAVPVGLAFNTDGTKMFVVGHEGDDVTEYSLTTPFSLVNVSGEHSGDVINTSSTDNYDTDPDGDTLTVTTYSHTSATDEDGGSISSTSSTGTAGTNNVTGYYGTLDLEGDGSYTYTADLTATQALDPGDTVTDVFTYTVDDGNGETDTATITITVNGMNDAPTAVADTDSVDAGSTVTDEDGAGTLVSDDTDPDASSSLYVTKITGNGNTSNVTYNSTKISNAATIVGSKGTLTFGSDGSYSYVADSDATSGDDVFTYTLTDGTSTSTATLTISVTEVANNAPTITAQTDVAGAVTEITDGASGEGTNNLTDTGSFTIADLDNDSVSVSTAEGTTDAVGGSFLGALTATVADDTDDGSGQINWTYTVADADVEYLEAGETVTETFTVTVSDGNGGTVDQTVTVVITGANDTPTLTTGAVDVAVNEASDASAQDLSSSGTITFADLDETTSITAATSTVTGSSGVSIPSAVNTALLSAITVTDNSDNTAGWTLSATDLDLDFLTAGQTITLEKVVTATDGQSATVTDTITVTITGTNDAPTLTTGAVDVAVNEASDASAQDLSSSGTITFADLDETTSITAATSTVTGSSGVSIPSAVNTALLSAITVTDNSDNTAGWTLSATDLDLDFLTAGQTITLEKVVTATDGQSATVTDTITVTITGTNDAPTLTTGAVDVDVNEASDASAQDLSSSGTITFADLDETTSITAATSTVTGSSGVSIPSAVNTALLSAITVTDNSDNTAGWTLSATDLDLDFLTAGQTITLEKVVTATDGQSATVTDTITVTITGTNDAPTITAQTDVAGAVTEITDGASGEGTNNLTDTGSFTIADLDNDSVSVSTAEGTTDAVGGSFLGALTATVADDTDDGSGQINWTYTVADADVEYLEAGETVTETFTVTVSDGNGGTVDQTVTVVITGANDTPTLTTGAVDVAVNEASDASAQDLSSSGTITFADLDETTSITAATSTVTGSSGVSIPSAVNTALLSAITVTDNSDNTAGWTLSATDLDLDFLTAGQTITLEKVVTATDGQSATVTDTITVTITGTNDAPTLTTGAVDVAVNEASDASAQDLSSSGTITFADLDETTSITAATSTVTGSSGVSIPSAVNTALLSAITVTDNSDNTAGWTLSATDLDLDFLTAGQTITLEKVVTATDGQSATVTDTITVTITGTNDAPTLTTGAVDVDVNEASDASAQDLSSSGTITFADLDETTSITAATSTVTGSSGVSIPSAVNTALLSAITVTDNSDNTAGWTLSATDLDLDFLTAGQTITLEKVVTATDGQSATVTDTITVTITGTNDAPTITAQTDVAGAVTEITDGASGEGTNNLTDTGSFTIADLDNDSVSVSTAEGTTDAVGGSFLGALTATVADDTDDGSGQINWTYTVADADVEYLEAGETVTETFTVTVSDGNGGTVDQTVTVVITGANDTPTLTTGAVDVAVNEASDASAQDLSSSGTITFADLDETTSITAATSTVTGSSGVSIPSAVNTALLSAITVTDNSDNTAGWTLSATDLDLDFLTAGQTITLEKVVTATDGQSATVTDTITVTITGTNDAPTLTTGAVDVDVNEASDASAQDLSSSGTITFADLDETTSITAATSTVTGSSGVSIPSAVNTALLSAITVTDNSDNTAGWTLSATDLDLDFLTAGQTITLEKVVTATDGQSATVTDTITVTITGTNDAPTITAQTDVAGAVTEITDGASGEGTNNLTDTGSFTIADLDNDSVSVSTAEGTTDAVGGSFLGALTATVADDTDDGSGQINWTYTVADADVEYLEAGETVTETFTVTVSDGNGGTVDQTVTVVITGANDTPTLTTGAVDVAVNEASDASAQDLSSSGTITFADLDETTSITAATSTVTGSSGVSIPSAVNTALLSAITVTDNSDNTAGWTLSATDLDLDFLTAGQTITLEKVVTATDGQSATVTDTITVTITGTNDAPTLTTGAVDVAVNEASDASAQDLSSSGTITFADLDETTSITAATSTVTGSSGVSIPSAVNTALLSAITVTDNSDNTAGWTLSATDLDLDFLTAGQTITLEKVVTATDGQSATVTDTITVTITGTNDAPTLTTGAVDVDVNEASDASAQDLSSSGTITFADLDETTSITAATSTVTGSSGVSIPSAVNTALLSAITVTDNSDNTAGWTLSATDLDLDFLTAGQTITLEKVVTATDGQSATVTDTITVTITGTNDAPVANVDTINVTVGTPATGNVITSSDTDPDGDSLTVSAIAGGSVGSAVTGTYGTFTLNSNGSYTYTVDTTNSDVIAWQSGDAVLTETFTYTVSDGTATDTATITVNASGQNDAPTANDDTINVTVGTPATGNVITSSDTDPDSDSLTVSAIAGGSVGSAVTGTYGTFTLNSNGSYTYTVDTTNSDVIAWQSGDAVLTETFTYTVSDGNGGTDTATITVNASGQNDAPTANDDTINVTVGTPATGNVITSSDTDPDGDSLTVSAIAGGSVGSAVTGTYGTFTLNSNGSYTYTVDTTNSDVIAWQSGDAVLTETFTYTVSDGNGGTDTATITVNASGQNDAPTAADNTVTTNEDTNHTFAASEFNFTDVDGDSLDHISIETLPSNGTLLLSGNAVSAGDQISVANISNLVFRPVANANGDDYDTFTFSVNDGTVDSGTYTMTIDVTAVNDAPLATDDADAVNEDATITESSGSELLVADDTDTDGNTLTVTQIAITGGSNSSVTSSTTYSNGTSITGTYGTLTVGANGSYTYVADQSASDDLDASDLATDSFTYTISDGTTTDTATLIITVTGINDVPTASDNTVSTAEDNPYVFSTSDFGFTDADDDDALVSIKITTLETNGALQYYNGSAWVDVTLNQVITSSDITSGYLRLNPDASENGSPYTTFNFTVNDGDADSATPNTITVNVTSVNDAPVAQDDIGTVNEDATTTVSSASSGVIDDNDTDAESDTLIITNIAHTNGNTEGVTANTTYSNGQSIVGTYGTLTIGANGTYAYVADQDVSDALDLNDQVTDVFTYTISDGNGGTDTATITITVTGVNDAPTSTGGTITTNEDENYILSVSDFNFSDPDDSGSLNKVKITTLETNGNLEYYNGTAWVAVTLNQEINASDITSGYLRFRPDANENGSSYTTFGYQVSDGTVYSSATTMTVNVTAVNDAPVATDDASSVTEDSNVRVRASEDDLLNDDSDTESDSLSVTLIKPLNGSNTSISSGSSTTITGTYGQLTVKSNGAYNYKANQDAADTLDTGESAEEQFVYTVSDGNGGTDTGILTITINGIEDDPNAVKDNISLNISESLTLTGNATTNDIDPDDSLTIVACGQGRNPNVGTAKTVGTAFDSNYGQMTINTDGSYTFVAVSNIKELLEPGQSVTEKFYYTVSDGNSTSTAMIEVTVQRDNVVNELSKKEQKQIKKQISKDRVNQPSTIRLEKIPTIAKPFEQSASALDNLSNLNRISFNEGIKLVDLVAQTGSFKTTDGSLDKVQAKQKNGQLNLQFKVSAELGNEIVKYEAVMPDGSKIPDWIKVDPKTGETITEIPEEIELVDFIIIATDKQNNKKEISVSIDPKEIKEDKSIFKKAKKQNASISVDQNGNVNIVNTNESGDVNQAETKNINANDKQNSDNNIKALESNFDNANSIRKIIETIKSEQVYQLQTINNGEVLETKVPETLIGNFEKTKLVLKDGSAIPDWVEFDPVTGEISVNLPNDIDKLEFKLIVESDGKIIVSDLEIDVRGDEVAQNLQDIENTRFIAFKDQLNKEHDNWEEYGSNIINRL